MSNRTTEVMLAAALFALLLVAGCAKFDAAPPPVTLTRGDTDSAQTVSEESEAEWGTATTEAYSGAQVLGVTMRVQRLAPDGTDAPDVYAELSADSVQALIQANPLWSIAAITETDTIIIADDGAPAWTDKDSPVRTSGFYTRRTFKLPRGATDLVLTVHLGPSVDLAASGVRLSLPVGDVPVVAEFSVDATRSADGMSHSF